MYDTSVAFCASIDWNLLRVVRGVQIDVSVVVELSAAFGELSSVWIEKFVLMSSNAKRTRNPASMFKRVAVYCAQRVTMTTLEILADCDNSLIDNNRILCAGNRVQVVEIDFHLIGKY